MGRTDVRARHGGRAAPGGDKGIAVTADAVGPLP